MSKYMVISSDSPKRLEEAVNDFYSKNAEGWMPIGGPSAFQAAQDRYEVPGTGRGHYGSIVYMQALFLEDDGNG